MRKVLLCLIGANISDELSEYLNGFDSSGYEVHVFDNIISSGIQPEDIPVIIDAYINAGDEPSKLFLLTDMESLIVISYRIYNQLFKGFVFFSNDKESESIAFKNSIYSKLLDSEIKPEEDLYKSIYLIGNSQHTFKDELLNTLTIRLQLDNIGSIEISEEDIEYTKCFFIENAFYIFEPILGDLKLIYIDEDGKNTKISYDNTSIFSTNLIVQGLRDRLEGFNKIDKFNIESYYALEDELDALETKILELPGLSKNFNIIALELMSTVGSENMKIFIKSFLVRVNRDSKYVNSILQDTFESKSLQPEEKFFVLFQVIRVGFVNTGKTDGETGILIRKLYRSIVQLYTKATKINTKFVPKEKRNKDLVFVFTSQVLGMNHGPTKTLLDRCYTLVKKMNKQVLIINTADMLSVRGFIPFYKAVGGNYIKQYESMDSFEYKDIKISFYQTSAKMPDVSEIKSIVNSVIKQKPYFILNIGGANITADICSKVVPVLTVATVMGVPITEGQFALTGKKISVEEKDYFRPLGITEENIVEGTFTFDFKPQTNHYTRDDFKLPKDKFLLLVVGARLDYEVTEDFLEAIKRNFVSGAHLVFAGDYKNYDSIVEKDSILRENSTFLGFQTDMLAICELCDLYVNPPRVGGQTSAAEAMFKGLPVVTLNYGDVSVCVDKEFNVSSLDEVTERINMFIVDKEYYDEMSEKAKLRAKVLLDTDEELVRVIKEVESRKLF